MAPNINAIEVLILVGTAQELAKGKGRTAVIATEAASRLRVSERTFRSLIAAGEISPIATLLRSDLFDAAEVLALQARRATTRG